MEGQCNYAFTIVLKKPNFNLRDRIEDQLTKNRIEYRRGMSGGGNQLRQPYFRNKNVDLSEFKVVDHIHNFSWYIGNYPSLNKSKIKNLLKVLNEVK